MSHVTLLSTGTAITLYLVFYLLSQWGTQRPALWMEVLGDSQSEHFLSNTFQDFYATEEIFFTS